jgi:hypothetical protein
VYGTSEPQATWRNSKLDVFCISWGCTQNLDHPGVSYCAKITHDENAITNAIEIYDNSRFFLSHLVIHSGDVWLGVILFWYLAAFRMEVVWMQNPG